MAGLSDTLNHRGSNVVQIYPKYPVLHRNKPKSYPQQDPCCSINYGMSSPNFTPCFGSLFPNAKMLENIPQHLVRGDFAEDGAEVVEGLAEVFGEEVGSLAGGEGTFDVFEGF